MRLGKALRGLAVPSCELREVVGGESWRSADGAGRLEDEWHCECQCRKFKGTLDLLSSLQKEVAKKLPRLFHEVRRQDIA